MSKILDGVDLVISGILLVTGLINGLPIAGVAGSGPLAKLYGTAIVDPGLLVLMRHRAVLLGLLGAALVTAAFLPAWRVPAMVAGLVSMLVFVALAARTTTDSSKIATTMWVDVVLSVGLAGALALHLVVGSA